MFGEFPSQFDKNEMKKPPDISEVHKLMSSQGLLRVAIINPHLPVFKLDKVADNKNEQYKFFEKRGIDKEWVEELI